jgi:glucosyl-dolichyl phosphate glucuronosyltransferase
MKFRRGSADDVSLGQVIRCLEDQKSPKSFVRNALTWAQTTFTEPMNISVILCTYNRCQSLAKALESVAASEVPESTSWEVIVADNNSRDETRQIVDGFSQKYPGRFRYLFEARQGKSYALNAAIREAQGDVLAFTDDDVTVEPTWLWNLTAHLFGDGQWAGSGGRTLPASVVTPPRWLALNTHAAVLYAHFDLGDQPLQLPRPPYGANMAFRRKMFEEHGEFHTYLGPGPPTRPIHRFGEDTEFGYRLIAAGQRLRYEPSAVVYHAVSEERIQKEHFLASSFELGRYSIVQGGKRPSVWGINRNFFSVPYKLGVILVQTLRWMLTWNPQRRFDRRCLVWTSAGYLAETCWPSCSKEKLSYSLPRRTSG